MTSSLKPLQWDIFCKVIDNLGDIGVCWRLATDLASRGQQVRLWADDASALAWMAPGGCAGVRVLRWSEPLPESDLNMVRDMPADVLIEAFGCDPAPEFMAACVRHAAATGHKPVWINLEYLSAEPHAARNHALLSPVGNGAAAGWTKWFFYPGFNGNTGGLLREDGLAERQLAFGRDSWLKVQGIDRQDALLVSLFCYEPPALPALLHQLNDSGLDGRPVRLLVTQGRANRAVRAAIASAAIANSQEGPRPEGPPPFSDGYKMLSISYLPLLTQRDFDHLLWACDLNLVRGEDSAVRALWAGRPFAWQLYPQHDGAQHAKLEAFLEVLKAPASLRSFHHMWNASPPPDQETTQPAIAAAIDLPAWRKAAQAAKEALNALPGLTASLMKFVHKNR